jgi:hypothetical protein
MGNEENKKSPPGEWQDLTNFESFLKSVYSVTMKEESGSNLIKSIDNASGSVYIVIGTDEEFTEAEGVALHHFVESGGNLIVMADNINVNNLSKQFGVEYSDHAILDKAFDYNYTFIPITVVSSGGFFDIVVHSPRGLIITAKNYQILGTSSERPGGIDSVLDLNDNRIIDATDNPGPIPIIVEVPVKSGRAIFISDAGLATDNLWSLISIDDDPEYEGKIYQNNEFIINLVSDLHEPGGMMIYDISKQTASSSYFHPYPPPG